MQNDNRKVCKIMDLYSTNEILYAASKPLRREVRSVKNILSRDTKTSLSSDKVLALFFDADLSKATYQLLHNNALELNSPIYCSEECQRQMLPNDIQVSDNSAEVPLQPLLQHTAQWLCEAQIELLTADSEALKNVKKLTLRSKIGFNGATGQLV